MSLLVAYTLIRKYSESHFVTKLRDYKVDTSKNIAHIYKQIFNSKIIIANSKITKCANISKFKTKI